MLINCTNHPYSIWNVPQREAAKEFGTVVDMPFPEILPEYTSAELRRLTDEYYQRITQQDPSAVMVAGEFTFAFMLVDRLLRNGVRVICTCSKRQTVEIKNPNGSNEKRSIFVFERFRDYEYYEGEK